MKYYFLLVFLAIATFVKAQEYAPTLENVDSIYLVKRSSKEGKVTFKIAATRFNNGDTIKREFVSVDSATLLQIVLGTIFEEQRAVSQLNKSSIERSQRIAGINAYKKFTEKTFKAKYEVLITPILAKNFAGVWQVLGAKSMVIQID